jgi:hypothetical protein
VTVAEAAWVASVLTEPAPATVAAPLTVPVAAGMFWAMITRAGKLRPIRAMG